MRKTMTALEMALELQARGYKVKVVKRTEGKAVRISSINGKKFTGSKGNIEARKLLGTSLTVAQEKHIEKIASTQKKGVFGKARKEPLPADFIQLQNKANRAFKKIGQTARVTRDKIRYRIENYGEDEARAYLKRAVNYAKGFAHFESLEALIKRLELLNGKLNSWDIEAIINRLKYMVENSLALNEFDFEELLHLIYTFEIRYGTPQEMSTSTLRHRALQLLKKAE